MAAARSGRVSLPIFRIKNPSQVSVNVPKIVRFCVHSTDSSPQPTHTSLLQKLLKAPLSRIKPTLDSEVSSESAEPQWASLLTYLNASAPQKANLVMEWILEKLMKERVKNEDSYSELLSLCAKIRNLPISLLIFTSVELQGVKPTTSTFNVLLSTCLSTGNFLTALSLFEIMEGSNGYLPNSDTYDSFISAYGDIGNKRATEDWFLAKKASGFCADAQSYGFLILSCCKSKQFEEAERYYEEMLSAGIRPSESIFCNMLLMYCQQRNLAKVKGFLKCDGEWRISVNLAKEIVLLYQDLGVVEELEELLLTLTKSNQVLEVLSLMHSSIIRMYARTDKLDDVEYSVGRMLNQGVQFSSSEDVEEVISCYFRREAYDRLNLFLERIEDSYKLTRSAYDLLGAGYKRAGLSERLELLVHKMKLCGFL